MLRHSPLSHVILHKVFISEFFFCHCSAILYNVALNIKQTQTESELESLRMMLNNKQNQTESELDILKMMINTHKELFKNISSDMIEINEKIKVVGVDLENVRTSGKDMDEKIKVVEVDLENVKASSKEMYNRLLDYASKMTSTETSFMSSGGGSFLSKKWQNIEILAIFIMLLWRYTTDT